MLIYYEKQKLITRQSYPTKKAAANIWLLQSQLNEHNRALEYTLSFLSLPSDSSGLKEHRISAQQKALAVVRNPHDYSKKLKE